jgi:hypothetical protein
VPMEGAPMEGLQRVLIERCLQLEGIAGKTTLLLILWRGG